MITHDWSVIVVKTKPENARETLVRLYWFIEGLIDVNSIHFMIRDRMQDGVVFSLRVRMASAEAEATKSAMRRELDRLAIIDGAVDPPTHHPLHRFTAWTWQSALRQRGADKFTQFCEYLSQFSRIVVDMAEHEYFTSRERAEMAHEVSWMLGLTECGVLRVKGKKGVEIGYYDRIENTTQSYLTYHFTDNQVDPP
jgi:hypothetical protein